jgi:hypothetical protein
MKEKRITAEDIVKFLPDAQVHLEAFYVGHPEDSTRVLAMFAATIGTLLHAGVPNQKLVDFLDDVVRGLHARKMQTKTSKKSS